MILESVESGSSSKATATASHNTTATASHAVLGDANSPLIHGGACSKTFCSYVKLQITPNILTYDKVYNLGKEIKFELQ